MSDSQEFLKRLQATFMVEAAEHCQTMLSGLLELESAPAEKRRKLIEKIFRCAHSLKGAARAVNHAAVEAICQRLESVFDAWKRQRLEPAPASFDVLHRAVDRVRMLVQTAAPQPTGAATDLTPLLAEIERLDQASVKSASAAAVEPTAMPPAAETVSPAPAVGRASARLDSHERVDGGLKPALPPASETIRVATAKVERVLYATEELLAVKSILSQRVLEVREAMDVSERSRREWVNARAAVRRSGQQSATMLDPSGTDRGDKAQPTLDLIARSHEADRMLEQKLATLVRLLDQDRHTFGKSVDYLLDETKKLLLLPFATESAFYSKLVRDLARDQGKQIDFVVRGGDVELDKRILEGMKDPLVHLLRNAVDHGMEAPDARAAAGKPARGRVTLAASRVDEQKVEIVVEDDGAGIDFDAIRKATVRRGTLSENAAAGLSDEETLAYIFRSEITTSPIVTEVSGRGVGLAIVQETVERLNGRVTIHSQPGRGARFRIVLPVAQDTFRGVLVSVAANVFVVPAAKVERVHRVAASDIKTVENRATITVDRRAVSFVWLGDVLNFPRRETGDSADKFIETVVVGPPDRSIAFGVDGVLGEEEVLVKPLRKPLCRVRNLSGATVLGSGRVVLILNVTDLLKSAIAADAGRLGAAVSAAKTAPKQRSILVVEDSITSRMLLKNILESAGYTVKTAVDGLDAITTLRSEPFDLVVSDIEMPRMNGFGLTAAIRADRRLAEIPVILVTALATREDRERGIDAGANAYIVKSDFDQSNLLESVQRFL